MAAGVNQHVWGHYWINICCKVTWVIFEVSQNQNKWSHILKNDTDTGKQYKSLELKEGVNAVVEIASYECMLSRKNGNQEKGVSPWDSLWTPIKMEDKPACSSSLSFYALFIILLYVLESTSILYLPCILVYMENNICMSCTEPSKPISKQTKKKMRKWYNSE